MIRRSFRRAVVLALLAGVVVALQRALQSRRIGAPAAEPANGAAPWPRLDVDAPEPKPTDTATAAATWAEPVDGACPLTHPVKASVDRGIFHVPGGASYARMQPERCYRTPEDAVADGLRQASR